MWGGKGREEPTRWGREGGGDREKRRGERRTREDGGNLSVTRRASGNERTPGNVYVLHKEGPPCVPLRSRARARTRALVPLASRAAPRHVLSPASSPLCIQPIANLRCDATHVQRVPKVPRCLFYLPARLPRLAVCLLACHGPLCLLPRLCSPICPTGLPSLCFPAKPLR